MPKSYLIPILKNEESTKFNPRNWHIDMSFKFIKFIKMITRRAQTQPLIKMVTFDEADQRRGQRLLFNLDISI